MRLFVWALSREAAALGIAGVGDDAKSVSDDGPGAIDDPKSGIAWGGECHR
jgi:hypothetical protein